MNGITYTTLGESARGRVSSYHYKPQPIFRSKTPHKEDITGLKPVQQRGSITFDGVEYSSRFTIGMEVEKNSLHRGAVKEYELFCGFETDGSCGYEAVTHILPLLPSGQWRTKVFDMMHKAEKIIDDRFSPSDRRCGGHITIGVDGMSGNEIREAVRKNCGIVLSLFRKRLTNSYCGYNKRMLDEVGFVSSLYSGGWHSKYQTALVKGRVLEFRIPSRFQSVKQMMRRYELFYEIVNFSINKPNGSHEALLKILRPIILSMYNGSVAEAYEVINLSRHFRKFILKGEVHEDIVEFLR
jgi:hypothetical protein